MGVTQGRNLVATLCVVIIVSCFVRKVFSQGTDPLPMPLMEPTATYPFVAALNVEYTYILRWNYNLTHVDFEVQVRTIGYVGFGISETDKMFPADVFIAYIADNNVIYGDFHTDGHIDPKRDISEDWYMNYGFEENGWTVLGFSRLLDTCDYPNDLPITRNSANIIWAYGLSDLKDLNSLRKHSRMGKMGVSLLTYPRPPAQLPSDITPFYFLNDNYTVPARRSSNRCRAFILPDNMTKSYIIKSAPIFSPETRHIVGHMALYRCVNPNPSTLFASGESFDCMTDSPGVHFCKEYVASFGQGAQGLFFPEDIAVPIGGGQGEPNVYVLHTRYDNHFNEQNLVDNSGIELTVTSIPRTHEAAYLSLGNIVAKKWSQFIPPGNKNFLQRAYCSMKCLVWGNEDCNVNMQIPSVPMTVAGVQFHANSLAKEMKLRHLLHYNISKADEKPWMDSDDSFDSGNSAFRELKDRKQLSCWEELLLECTYDSTSRQRQTRGGWSDLDELCRAYVLYYPRKRIEGCMSWSNFDQFRDENGAPVPAGNVFNKLKGMTWASRGPAEDIINRNLITSLETSYEHAQCWSSRRDAPYATDYFKQTEIRNKYSEPSTPTCPQV